MPPTNAHNSLANPEPSSTTSAWARGKQRAEGVLLVLKSHGEMVSNAALGLKSPPRQFRLERLLNKRSASSPSL